MAPVKKSKSTKTSENINSRLQLVVKSGKVGSDLSSTVHRSRGHGVAGLLAGKWAGRNCARESRMMLVSDKARARASDGEETWTMYWRIRRNTVLTLPVHPGLQAGFEAIAKRQM